jgi:hypothetical protein
MQSNKKILTKYTNSSGFQNSGPQKRKKSNITHLTSPFILPNSQQKVFKLLFNCNNKIFFKSLNFNNNNKILFLNFNSKSFFLKIPFKSSIFFNNIKLILNYMIYLPICLKQKRIMIKTCCW